LCFASGRMSQHFALFYFAPRSLIVRGEVLGTSYLMERNGLGVIVNFPAKEGDFGPVGEDDPFGEGLISKFSWHKDTGEIYAAVAKVIQVAVAVESSASSEKDTEEGRADGERVLAEGLAVAISVVEDFVAWMRTEGQQPWMGPSHEPIELVRSDLVDAERGGVVGNVSIPRRIVVMSMGEGAAGVAEVEAALSHVASEDVVAVADVLLADAREAMDPPSVSVEWQKDPRDTSRAVLLAAIASEVKIKTTLVEKAPEDRRDLIKIIVSNPRDITVAAAQLVHKTMKGAVGRSLHEDDPGLFEAVEKLFRTRNRLAHDARRPTTEEADQAVTTAVELFRWLDGL
jgi:hypothetical protein